MRAGLTAALFCTVIPLGATAPVFSAAADAWCNQFQFKQTWLSHGIGCAGP